MRRIPASFSFANRPWLPRLVVASALVIFSCLPAEEVIPIANAAIPGVISEGWPSPPMPLPVLPDFVVKNTVVRKMEVVEAPPMSGLPPVTGTIIETVHLVEDPQLPDPPPPPAPPLDSGTQIDLGNRPEQPRLLFLSATVYNHSRTLLRCHPSGNLGKEITVWSNLDFNCFCGFHTFKVTGANGEVRTYDMLGLGISNEDTEKRAQLMAKHGREYAAPEIPTLPDGDPAYVIVDDNPDKESVQIIEDLHQFYRNEGPRIKEDYLTRIKEEAAKRAFFIAHPPVPKDRTIHFWQRDHPVGMSTETIKKEGGNL